MDKKMLQETFREWKKISGARYAITNPDGLGDCPSCVNAALADKYGMDSKGIFAKHWTRGMNGDYPIDDKRIDHVYIGHDIDEEMAKAFYEVFGKNYNIVPAEYDPSYCFILYEKDTAVYAVTYTEMWNGKAWKRSHEFTKVDAAVDYLNRMFIAAIYRDGDEAITDIALVRLF